MAEPRSWLGPYLIDGRDQNRQLVRAEIHRDCPTGILYEVEDSWAAARKQAYQLTLASGRTPLEHDHWDWRRKAAGVDGDRYLLVAVTCGPEHTVAQGIMAMDRLPRRGRAGTPVMSIDYLETAPWNLRGTGADPRYLGVGSALFTEAVRISVEGGLGGGVGLHSLPQAERFYHGLGLTDYGPDPSYFDLCYFEFAASAAETWLTSLGGRA